MCGLIAACHSAGIADEPLVQALTGLSYLALDSQPSLWREEHHLHLVHGRPKFIGT